MFGLKATLITGAAGLVVSLGLAFLWKSEQAKSARLEGELSQALANTETLKAAVEDQKLAFNKMASLAKSNQEWVNVLTQERDHANTETAKVRSEINALRAAEANRALVAPFDRGNIARQRFTDSLRRIANSTGGLSPDSDDTDTAGTGSSQ